MQDNFSSMELFKIEEWKLYKKKVAFIYELRKKKLLELIL